MVWIDATSILLALVTLGAVLRCAQEVKQMLTDARYERLGVNRRLERIARRLDELEDREPEHLEYRKAAKTDRV
jgi:hypothetical protein